MPSVTEILGVYNDFSRVPKDRLQAAADRGTRVHHACAAIANGIHLFRPDNDIDGYVDSFRKWFDNVEDVLLCEKELYHSIYEYHGHPDLVIKFFGETCYRVVDIKTPIKASPTWPSQIAAYERLVLDLYRPIKLDHSGTLSLAANGTEAKFTDYSKTRLSNWLNFLAALQAYKAFKEE